MGESIAAKDPGLKSLQLHNVRLKDASLSTWLSQEGHSTQIGQLTSLKVYQCQFHMTDWRAVLRHNCSLNSLIIENTIGAARNPDDDS